MILRHTVLRCVLVLCFFKYDLWAVTFSVINGEMLLKET